MDVREIGWEGVFWMHLDQGRDQWRVLVNNNEPWVSTKGEEFLD
jgi:hypothetical protein